MGRGHLSEFAERFKRVLSARTVNALGRLTRFCQRERVITPHRMAMSLLASCARGEVQTLADLHRDFNALFGTPVLGKTMQGEAGGPEMNAKTDTGSSEYRLIDDHQVQGTTVRYALAPDSYERSECAGNYVRTYEFTDKYRYEIGLSVKAWEDACGKSESTSRMERYILAWTTISEVTGADALV